MRVTRAKQYRRHLRFFRIVYGISAPYKVILDGNFIHGCISSKVDIEKRLTSVLQGAKMHLFVPRSAREELKALGPEFQKAYNFAIGHCRGLPPPRNENQAGGAGSGSDEEGVGAGGGEKGPDPAKEIIAAIGADNEGKYLVASQDENLRMRLRRVPGCPLVFVSRTVLVMEQPSGKSKAEFEKAERKKAVGTTEEEDRVLAVLKKREREERERERALQPRKRLKKRATAPNPLSAKKSSKGKGNSNSSSSSRGGGGSGAKGGGAEGGAAKGKAAGTAASGGSGNRVRRKRKKPSSSSAASGSGGA
ncbi:unnamed protein product [Ectocarpus sp. CCAP 1310/34]|nr:unnamed protein product [Ectocarpus sp. CCAP 1310/34]